METDIFISVVGILGLLLLSGFFSGSEVAFFSLDRKKLKESEGKLDKYDTRINRLLERPRKLLVTILVGNTIVNVGIAILAAILALRLAYEYGFNPAAAIAIEVVLITFLIIIFSEITPKVLASKRSREYARFASFPISVFFSVIYPVSEFLVWMVKALQDLFKLEKYHRAISNDELKTLADVGAERGSIEKEESRMLHWVADFGDTTVREIMVSRVDMVAIKTDTSIKFAMDIIKESGHSRIPVYDEELDNIKGILYAKDLLPYLSKGKKRNKTTLKSIVRDPLYVPENKQVADLLREFQEKKTHIALAVDEYGGVSGLVTLEDIIEEIIGDIKDEHDRESSMYKTVGEREYLFNPTLGIHEVEELFNLVLTREDVDYDTLAGFLITNLGDIPKKGQRFHYLGLDFIVERVRGRRITLVRVIDRREFPPGSDSGDSSD